MSLHRCIRIPNICSLTHHMHGEQNYYAHSSHTASKSSGSRKASDAADDVDDAEEPANDHVSSERSANNSNDTFTAILHYCNHPPAAVPYPLRGLSSSEQSFPAVQMGDLQMLLNRTTAGS